MISTKIMQKIKMTLDSILPMAVRDKMCNTPIGDEVLAALSRINVGKAAGSNGLLPDIVKCCGGLLLDWEREVPAEWRDATLVPVLKKGDLSVCDNWRGISLLDVMDKLFQQLSQHWITNSKYKMNKFGAIT